MDLTTILGIVSGVSLILLAIFIQSGLGIFVSLPSLLIVTGGTIAATLISYPLDEVIKVIKIAGKAFYSTIKEPTYHMLELISLAVIARREGVLHLPVHAKKLNDFFILKGAQMVADGIPRQEIIRALNTEITIMQSRHKLGREIFQALGVFAPAFGLIGTLIGLVQMLSNLSDPSKLGPGMSTAILTTFYGAVLANLIFLPIANKLKRRSEQEFLLMQITKETILSIQAKESITLLEDKLSSYISRTLQQSLKNQKPK
ncbi:MAG: MotA/TolQ/ExbB proton channel family protein [Candidatus Margulisbacteria bacterium]|nr:MotA/TolQ/ExbB proton channel family protein [Candidatus Margulisiibacteriota bacterium]